MSLSTLFNGYTEQNKIRIVAFGSSVVERTIEGTHWFDCLDMAIASKFGRVHQCLNCGQRGDTTQDLLNRFDNDLVIFKPHVTFVKVGGNDTEKDKNIGAKEFKKNMQFIVERLKEIGSKVIFMTYHLPIPNIYGLERTNKLKSFMEVIRDTSKLNNIYLIDDMKLWETLCEAYPNIHRRLIEDDVHLTPLGNLFLGLSLLKQLKLDMAFRDPVYWKEANDILQLSNAKSKLIEL